MTGKPPGSFDVGEAVGKWTSRDRRESRAAERGEKAAWRPRMRSRAVHIEAGLLLIVAGAFGALVLAAHLAPRLAGIVTGAAVALLLLEPDARRWVTRLLVAQHRRREWFRATVRSGAVDPPPERSLRELPAMPYRATKVRDTPAGYRLDVTIAPGGYSRELLERHAPALRVALRARDVLVHPGQTADRCTVHVVKRDQFRHAPPVPWPLRDANETSVWEAMPFALDEEGQTVSFAGGEGHVLIAGANGSGKSVALNLLVAHRALDPTARLYLFDNKMVELGPWQPAATQFVGRDMAHAVNVLRYVQRVMDERNDQLLAAGQRQVQPGEQTHHVVIEEASYYLNHPDDQHAKQFTRALLDLVQRGRSAGVRVLLVTQRPSVQIIDGDVRAQFTRRVVFRVNEAETTHMVLGHRNAPAHEIPEDGYAGVGYLGSDSHRTRRVRTFMLTVDDVTAIAQRAAALRADHDLVQLLSEADANDSPTAPQPSAARRQPVANDLPTPREPVAEGDRLNAGGTGRAAADRDALLRVLAVPAPGLSRRELEALLGAPERQWGALLRGMVRDGVVVREGAGKPRRPFLYRLAG